MLSWIFIVLAHWNNQPAGKHVAPLWHIILIPSQPVFALSPWCCVLGGEATNIIFVVFGLTRPGLEPTIYRTRGEHVNHYATDVVIFLIMYLAVRTTYIYIYILLVILLRKFWNKSADIYVSAQDGYLGKHSIKCIENSNNFKKLWEQ